MIFDLTQIFIDQTQRMSGMMENSSGILGKILKFDVFNLEDTTTKEYSDK